MGRIALLALLATAIAGGALFLHDERNRHFLGGQTHLREDQSFLNVRLGDDTSAAERSLAAGGFRRSPDMPQLNNCGSLPIGIDQTVLRFEDTTWRHGSLCIIEQGGAVSALVVTYAMFIT